jgi:C1A family cysteine protease
MPIKPIRSKFGRQYPLVKDTVDANDSKVNVSELKVTPSAVVDLRPFCGPIKDQGSLGSCSAHAATEMREFLYRKYNAEETNKTVAAADFILSPLYLYYKEREFEGDIKIDGGAQLRTAAKMLNNVGSCLLKDDPYNVNNFAITPTAVETTDALVYKSGAYHRITGGLDEMKTVLESGYTFILGMLVYESFEDDYTARTGTMLIPNTSTEKCLGGHAVHVVGKDDTKNVLIIQNSWGSDWGDKGYFYMPYQIASDPNIVQDCWVNHLGASWGTAAQIAEVIAEDVSVKDPTEHAE